MRRFLTGIIAALMIALPLAATAQEASPMATDAPGPEECTVSPIPRAAFNALVDAAVATPDADAAPVDALPNGSAADAETSAAVEATIRELAACFNANDTLRELALYTDRYIIAQLAGSRGRELTDAEYTAEGLATPVAAPDRAGIEVVGEIVQLDDARVAAEVQFSDDGSRAIVYLVDDAGTWKIDNLVFLDDEATPTR